MHGAINLWKILDKLKYPTFRHQTSQQMQIWYKFTRIPYPGFALKMTPNKTFMKMTDDVTEEVNK